MKNNSFYIIAIVSGLLSFFIGKYLSSFKNPSYKKTQLVEKKYHSKNPKVSNEKA